jgi:biopolymer transport protein ExbD
MAELDTSSSGGKKGPGVKKAKKLSTRIDLTPMVDLGFLLITFFIFTTTMAKPKTQSLTMPKNDDTIKEEDKTKIKESTVLTALLSKNHLVYYYEGIGSDPSKAPNVQVSKLNAAKGGIREAIINLRKKVEDLKKVPGSNIFEKDKATVIIKPDTNSTYDDVVNILDEMIINDITVYAIVDIASEDRKYIAITEQANGVK